MEQTRRRKWFKVLLIVAGGVVLLLLLVIATVQLWIDPVARHAIEIAGTEALGVETKVEDVGIRIFSGEAKIFGLNVANPAGYDSKHFLDLGHVSVAVTLRSLMDDRVEIPRIVIEDLDVNLEKNKDGYNYEKILENIESEPEPGDDAGGGKTFLIHDVVIRNVRVRYDVDLAVATPTIKVNISERRYENVGEDHEVTLREVMGILIKSILRSIAEAGTELPGDLIDGLGKGVSAVGKTVGSAVKDVGKAVGGVFKKKKPEADEKNRDEEGAKKDDE